ncbi:MAG: dephospho-CoA kinase, partial [Eubacteriales bacterium]|nr:dephospho-CoA kinase [Eubacteriales bacterium]
EGGVDRKRLSRLVFADAEQLSRLNAIAHRHITRAIRETLEVYAREGAEVAVLDAPTLFEAHADALCDCTAAVLAPVSLRVERLRGRDGLPDEAILARIRSQPDDAFFQTHCTYILRNDGDLETLRGCAAALYNTIKENAT